MLETLGDWKFSSILYSIFSFSFEKFECSHFLRNFHFINKSFIKENHFKNAILSKTESSRSWLIKSRLEKSWTLFLESGTWAWLVTDGCFGQGMTFGIRKYWKNIQNTSIWGFYDVFGEIWICNIGIRKNLGKFDLY